VATRLVRGEVATELEAPAAEGRVLDERIAAMITDILSDKTARMSAFGDQNVLELEIPVAAKTGTSKGYRDNVAVGYSREVTVAVWVGNFDGSPMSDVSGITGAGPIFREVMEAAARSRPAPARSRSLSIGDDAARLGLARTSICALSGEIPTSACPHRIYEWLPEGDADHAPPCATHRRVRLDVRNGLRAGPGCTSEVTTERVFERWRQPYAEWARRTNRALAPEASSPACPTDDGAADLEDTPGDDGDAGTRDPLAPRITYPFDGARFVIDPERPADLQLLEIRVEPEGTAVEVRVDDTILAKTRTWPLAPGTHTITARSGSHVSSPIRITVR
jgi:penicillin-binding protein 1C